jgi:sigma-B regulation protein RsbU (phosphoserine phosphatase)
MAAPLWLDDKVTGLLYVDRRFSAQQFREHDLALLTVLANLTAAKIENLKLLDEALLKRKLEEELSLAAEIQRSLLPAEDPLLPGYEFAGRSVASRSVGGDLLDYMPKEKGRMGMVVADVSGKGMSAALLMASLQANLRAFARSAPGLDTMMEMVNRALCEAHIRNKFATVFYAELAAPTGVIQYVNAGHCPGIVVRAKGGVEKLRTGGMIAGAFAELARYQVGKVELGRGDSMLLYSDGITEAEEMGGDQFGEERLEEAAVGLRGKTASGVRDGILEAVHAFTKGAPPSDDTTILVVRRA